MNRAREYLDLDIDVRSNVNGTTEIRVLNSPRNRPQGIFEPPFSNTVAAARLRAIEEAIDQDIERTAQLGESDAAPESAQGLDLEGFGSALFDSLFPPQVRDTLDASLERQQHESDGIRLRLSFDSETPYLAPYSALPWEILFHTQRQSFLAQNRHLPLVRYLDVPQDTRRFFVPPPLRILLVAADPKGHTSSSIKHEQKLVLETLKSVGSVEVECLSPPTLEALLLHLAKRETHVIHFMGHGGFSKKSGDGALVFETDSRDEDLVYGQQLAEKFTSFSTVRLVVLNACYGAAGRRSPNQDPFRGVASALIRHGIAAVVGMQFPISNKAAEHFAKSFYGCLAETGHVDAAISSARRELVEALPGSREWITPVLLTRAANGRLFDPRPAPGPGEPLRVGMRSMFGRGVEIEDWSDAFLPLTSYFRSRYLDEGVSWQGDIYPRLKEFLEKWVLHHRKVHLDFAAHSSLAFAAGYVLNVKAGIEITVCQRSAAGRAEWRLDDPPSEGFSSWHVVEHVLDSEKSDIALAVTVTRSVRADVESYVNKKVAGVGCILEFRPPEGAGALAIQNGSHAFRLAEKIVEKMAEQPGDWKGRFHLFYAGPNGLFFFLGRLAQGPRTVQLYEYDMDGEGNKSYTPSLVFPPPAPVE